MGFDHITDQELPVLARVINKEHNGNLEKTLKDLEFIDNAFCLIKSQSLLTRRSPRLRQQLDALLHAEVTGLQPVWDSARRRYNFVKD